jgi:hypothetical protein
MSSGISIEEDRLKPAPTANTNDGFQAWHFFVLTSLLLATVAVVLSRRTSPEQLILLSFTIGAAGAVAAALYRMLLPLVSDTSRVAEGPMTERRRNALEADKALVLRTIKELEFDRAMNKLSQKDFEEMSGRLRRRALALMKQLDEGVQYREIIERELSERLSGRLPSTGLGPGKAASTGSESTVNETADSGRGRLQPAWQPACQCGTTNDADAVFCKKCGTRLQAG